MTCSTANVWHLLALNFQPNPRWEGPRSQKPLTLSGTVSSQCEFTVFCYLETKPEVFTSCFRCQKGFVWHMQSRFNTVRCSEWSWDDYKSQQLSWGSNITGLQTHFFLFLSNNIFEFTSIHSKYLFCKALGASLPPMKISSHIRHIFGWMFDLSCLILELCIQIFDSTTKLWLLLLIPSFSQLTCQALSGFSFSKTWGFVAFLCFKSMRTSTHLSFRLLVRQNKPP